MITQIAANYSDNTLFLPGVSGVAHVASNMSLSPDPNAVIPGVINGALSVIQSAAREPSVKRVVYTSSSITTGFTQPNKPCNITTESWNDVASTLAWAPAPYEDDRKWIVYGASKTEAEKALWKFVEEEKPGFEFSTVLPSVNFGASVHKDQSSESLGWVQTLIRGDLQTARKAGIAPCKHAILPSCWQCADHVLCTADWFVDASDAARLHVAALIIPTVKSERIFAYSQPFNWSDILDILRKAYPERSWPENISDEPRDLSTVESRERSVELLKALGRNGFITLEESVKSNAVQII